MKQVWAKNQKNKIFYKYFLMMFGKKLTMFWQNKIKN
jgi:hypothetical protein